jgi:hypothetical protein
LAADRRVKMAQGLFDDVDSLDLRSVRDSTNAADERWELGQHTSEFFMQFDFNRDTGVTHQWNRARVLLQSYGDCADSVYRRFQAAAAPADACQRVRDSARRS